ncbi:hypothetical protein DFQ30_006386 [Apophysomyces sp. BC1015]|nr:hypothetical protein DFQ30_006386 [Apophysomyces sp. BC1015]
MTSLSISHSAQAVEGGLQKSRRDANLKNAQELEKKQEHKQEQNDRHLDRLKEQMQFLTQPLHDLGAQVNSIEKPKHEGQIADCAQLILKTYFKERNEIHRISCPDPTKADVPSPKYSWLREKIATCFNLAAENFGIEFVDHEQDNVSITNDDEFKDALKQTELVKEAPAPILRLHIYSRETIDSRSKVAATVAAAPEPATFGFSLVEQNVRRRR